MKWSKNELLSLFPSHRGDIHALGPVSGVFTDSRMEMRDSLFVPLVGERFDGHDFLPQAIDHGAVAVLWQIDHAFSNQMPRGFPVFFVEDTARSLGELAKRGIENIRPRVVAVTGSNGKTTTKDMIACVLQQSFQIHKTEGNLNNHIGLPLTVLSMPENCDMLVLEMGMNHFGEISQLSRLATPDIAVITNIGESHIEFLGSREGIAKAKMEILDGLKPKGKVIYDGDEPLLKELTRRPFISCGFSKNNKLQITSVKQLQKGFLFTLNLEENEYEIPLFGRHHVKNAAMAVAVACEVGVPEKEISEALRSLEVTNMRFQQLQGQGDALIINDAYNASPTSMAAAIETVKQLEGYTRKVLVLGDMYELGPDEKAFHQQIGEKIAPPITEVITVGPRAKWIADGIQNSLPVIAIQKKEDAVAEITPLLSPDTVVLFKASRAIGLETVVNQLKNPLK